MTRRPGRVQHLEHRAIAVAERIVRRRAQRAAIRPPPRVSDFGSVRPIFGICDLRGRDRRCVMPSRSRYRKKRRKLESCRAVERGRAPLSTRQAMKSSRSAATRFDQRDVLLR